MRARVFEVPIWYTGRTYEEGKKIGLKDAFKAVYTIVRFWGWTPNKKPAIQKRLVGNSLPTGSFPRDVSRKAEVRAVRRGL